VAAPTRLRRCPSVAHCEADQSESPSTTASGRSSGSGNVIGSGRNGGRGGIIGSDSGSVSGTVVLGADPKEMAVVVTMLLGSGRWYVAIVLTFVVAIRLICLLNILNLSTQIMSLFYF